MIYNERIKNLRLSHRMKLKEVSVKLGVTEATAQRYESNNIKVIPYEAIEKYAEMFGCSPAYIMGWEDETSVTLTADETAMIVAYRQAPEGRKEAIKALLNL